MGQGGAASGTHGAVTAGAMCRGTMRAGATGTQRPGNYRASKDGSCTECVTRRAQSRGAERSRNYRPGTYITSATKTSPDAWRAKGSRTYRASVDDPSPPSS